MTPATLRQYLRTAALLIDEATRLPITTRSNYQLAGLTIARVKRCYEWLDEVRRKMVAPLALKVATINNQLRPILTALEKAEAKLKDHLIVYRRISSDVPEIDGVSFREHWGGKVVDASLIPPQYLIPDEKALLALTRAKGSDPGIPGWCASPDTVVSVTAEKLLPATEAKR